MQRIKRSEWGNIRSGEPVRVCYRDEPGDPQDCIWGGLRGCFVEVENYNGEAAREPVTAVHSIYI